MFIWGPPGTLPIWARAFGYMNITAVLIQIVFPCSPPWYENSYGLAPANYSIPGDAAGLKAIDKLTGIDIYTSTFLASPMVFGAFPSLHSGWATLETLFMGHVFPRLFPVYVFYTMWLWWSTMYFSHHYAVDLVAGSLRTFLFLLPSLPWLIFPSCWCLLLLWSRQVPPSPAIRQGVPMGLRLRRDWRPHGRCWLQHARHLRGVPASLRL
jgi:hypothetical protein